MSPIKGNTVALSSIDDSIFSTGIMGEGIAISPQEDDLYAPCDGIITIVYNTQHAICLKADNGVEVLLHMGIDTVRLDGKYFECYVQESEYVKKGQKLACFRRAQIEDEGYDTSVIMTITNSMEFSQIHLHDYEDVDIEDVLITIR